MPEPNDLEAVELRPAYAWDCPKCGLEFFTRAIAPSVPPEAAAEMKVEMGLAPDEEGDFLLMPDVVTCPNCSLVFATIPYGLGDEDGD